MSFLWHTPAAFLGLPPPVAEKRVTPHPQTTERRFDEPFIEEEAEAVERLAVATSVGLTR